MTDQSVIIRQPMPKLVDKAERRQVLMQAALSVFAEEGYHRATMQAIADRAGCSKGSLYDYFTTKEVLLVETAEWLLTALFDAGLAELERAGTPLPRRIERFVDTLAGELDAWTDVCFTVLRLWAELGRDEAQPLRAMMSRMYRDSANRVQAVFDRSVADGEAPPFPTRAAALALMAALDGSILQATLLPRDFAAAIETGLLRRWCAAIVPSGGTP